MSDILEVKMDAVRRWLLRAAKLTEEINKALMKDLVVSKVELDELWTFVQNNKYREWNRYERKHSLSAGHIDSYEVDGSDIKVCIILDDASSKVLAGGEFSNINTENSKLVFDQVVDRYSWLLPMRELIMDHGSEFGAHRVHEDGTWNSGFKQHLEKHGINPILGSVAHPQTNGKLERFFQEYKRHRYAFHSIDEFIDW